MLAHVDMAGLKDVLVWLSEQALKTEEHGLDVVCSSPLVLQDVQADSTGEIDVGVVDGGLEEDGWGSVWVVGGELEGELE